MRHVSATTERSVLSDPSVSSRPDAAQRLVDHIIDILERDKDKPRQYRRKQKDLAELLGLTPPTVSQALKRREGTCFRMVHLDIIADYLGVSPADLVRRDESVLWELNTDEVKWLRYYRSWTTEVRAAVMAVLTYFAGLLPEERQQFRLWALYSPLDPADRARVEQLAMDLRELKRRGRSKQNGQPNPGPAAVPGEDIVERAGPRRTRPG